MGGTPVVAELTCPRKVDLLFVVDDSGSMCQEQDGLSRAFGQMDEMLTDLALDWRMAVVTTDMEADHRAQFRFAPANPVPLLNCGDPGTGEPFVPNTADCADLADQEPILNGSNVMDPAERARQFRCRITQGTEGDGFEKGLEAMRTALWCGGPNRAHFEGCCTDEGFDPACPGGEPRFLRPGAALVVVFLTDENDCSEPQSNPDLSGRAICRHGFANDAGELDDEDGDGIADGYNDPEVCPGQTPAECFAFECGTLEPEECQQQRCVIPRSENNACEWYGSNLTPVERYSAFLGGLKGTDDHIAITTIAGPPNLNAMGQPYRFGPPAADGPVCERDGDDRPILNDMCCPEGQCRGDIAISCESERGVAFDGYRYFALAEHFGGADAGCADPDAATCASICGMNVFETAFGQLSARLESMLPADCAAEDGG